MPDTPTSTRIDTASADSLAEWAKKLDTTESQLKDAVAKVGDQASDVEMHLKGTRSTTNDDRIEAAGAGPGTDTSSSGG